jgi:phosphoglycerate dehydrogenase-like enzyme
MHHIHISHTPQPEHLEHLHAHLDGAFTITTGDTIAPQTQILVSGRPSAEQLAAAPDLHALIVPFAGLPNATRDLMRDYPQIAVHNVHFNEAMTAEMAVALLLAASKRLLPSDASLRRGDWRVRFGGPSHLFLDRARALILGYGEIGQRVARILRGFGTDVRATRRTPGGEAGVYPPDELHDLLPETDALIITLPLTAETEGLIGADELALLPPGAVVVNVGRGPILDQHALYDALQRGHLRGAGIDVWWNYPPDEESRAHTLPADAPLHELDTVVMSPHRSVGPGSDLAERRRMESLAESLNAHARGESIPHRVDLDAGY